MLLLHGMDTVHPNARFLDLLGREAEIIAPSSPGFGNTKRPPDFDTIYDLVHLYLALIDELPFERIALLGLSFGGWLAAEIAVACQHKLDRLILADPLGIKLGDRESRDIADVFNLNPAEVRRRGWHDPAKAPSYDAMSDDELVVHARNREALCLYAWHPCLYNPQLKHWLGRIRVPTLVLWGDERPHRHPRLRPRLCRADPRRAVSTDRVAPATIPRSSSRSFSQSRSPRFCANSGRRILDGARRLRGKCGNAVASPSMEETLT